MRPGETVSTVTQACNRDRTPPIPTPHPETAEAAVRAFEQFKMACDAMRWIFASARTTMAAEEPRLSHEIPRTCSARWPHLQRAGPRQCVFKPDFSDIWWEFSRQDTKICWHLFWVNKTVSFDQICWERVIRQLHHGERPRFSRPGAHAWPRSAVGSEPSCVSRAETVCVSSFEGRWRQIFSNLRANGGSGPALMFSCFSVQQNNFKELCSRFSTIQSKRCPRSPNRPRKTLAQEQEQILGKSLHSPRKPKGFFVLGNHSASGIRQQIWRTLIAKEKMTVAGVTKLSIFKVHETYLSQYLAEAGGLPCCWYRRGRRKRLSVHEQHLVTACCCQTDKLWMGVDLAWGRHLGVWPYGFI